MDLFEAISARYSNKGAYLSEPVPMEDLKTIARAGLEAPSACNFQSVNMVIVTDPAVLHALCDVASSPGLRTARAAIVVMTDASTQTYYINYEKEDYSAAVQNMMLAVTALGYSSVWLDGILIEEDIKAGYRNVLGAPDNYTVWAILPIGKQAGVQDRRAKRPLDERMSYNVFGGSEE